MSRSPHCCSLLLLLLLACPTVAQHADSLLTIAEGRALTAEERVRIWHTLLRDRSVSARDLNASPAFRSTLQDTITGNGWSWLLLGSVHHEEASFEEATRAFGNAMATLRSEGDEAGVALAELGLSSARSMRGDQSNAMQGAFDALAILHRTGPVAEEAQAMLLLAYIFRYQEDFQKALEYYLQVGGIAENLKDPALRVEAIRGEAGLLLEQGRTEDAQAMYQEALSICERFGVERRTPILHVELANVRMKRADLSGARREFEDALELFEQRGNAIWTSYTLARLAEVAHRQGDENTALAYGQRGYALAKERGLMKEALDNLYILPEVSAAMGRYEEALGYSLAFEALNDTMRNDVTRTELARLEMQQEQVRDSLNRTEERARERIVYEANVSKARTQRNIFLFIGLGVLVLVGGLWNRLRHTRRLGRELATGNALVEQEVMRAERSESVKEQFLANMSHEIRTPMNAIMGMTAILRRNERLPSQERYLHAIAQSSSNLLVILNDILDLGKLEAGTVELEQLPMDPRVVVGNVLDILRFKAEEKGLKLAAHVAEEVPAEVLGDPTRLNQILVNLVGNAIKFTEKGGVTVDVVLGPEQGTAPAAGPEVPIVLRYLVRDTGIGIRKERINEIFEEFTQAYSDTTRKYGGTGLGLTITKRLIELQRGSVQVDSTPDQGSTFTVDIPYGRSSERTPVQANVEPSPVRLLDGLRILLVEDNDFNVIVAMDELQDAIPGARIDVAPNGRIALEKAGSGEYDVILMDIQMPEMNGFEATEAIRKLPGSAGRVPIIAMTANVLKSEVERCMAVGMNGFVPKPFDRQDLLEKIGHAVEKAPL